MARGRLGKTTVLFKAIHTCLRQCKKYFYCAVLKGSYVGVEGKNNVGALAVIIVQRGNARVEGCKKRQENCERAYKHSEEGRRHRKCTYAAVFSWPRIIRTSD